MQGGRQCDTWLRTGEANVLNESIYSFGLVTIGEDSVIPDGVKIGKNTAISGVTYEEDYKDGVLEGGEVIIKQVTENEGNRNNFGRRQQ